MGRHCYKFSVYHKKTEMPLILYATSYECAEAMGITHNSFYRYLCRIREGKIKIRKWLIYRDEEDLDDE